MQPTRTFIRSPQVCRIVRSPAPAAHRTMSLFSAPPFYPRFVQSTFPSISNDLAPFFRLMDDFTGSRAFDHFLPPAAPVRQFQPRFDVREVGSTYELRGELPGVMPKDLEVEFTDAQTLVIRGRTESETTSGTSPASTEATAADNTANVVTDNTANAVADNSDAASTHSVSSYQKPTVEEESAAEASSSTSTPAQPTPAESTTSEQPQQQAVQATATAAPSAAEAQAQAQVGAAPRYWISERSTGSFQRVFNFPSRVDQEAVTASLKNGVLNVIVPKAVAPGLRRINVE